MSRTTSLAPKDQVIKEAVHGHGLVAPPPIHIESDAFTGSLAQLFRLAREARVEMRDVMTLPICEAYFAYLAACPDASLDEAATALAILAYLVERKAWTLVPRVDAEPEPPEEASELVIPTPELYEPAVLALRQGLEERALLFFRTAEPDPDGYEVPLVLGDVGPGDLARAFERLLRRAAPTPPPPVARARPSLQETMRAMLARLTPEGRPLEALFAPGYTRADAVVGFLALLELIRLGQAHLTIAESESGEREILFAGGGI